MRWALPRPTVQDQADNPAGRTRPLASLLAAGAAVLGLILDTTLTRSLVLFGSVLLAGAALRAYRLVGIVMALVDRDRVGPLLAPAPPVLVLPDSGAK